MYNLNRFCNVIASLRKQKGWTQTMLSEKLGISPQSVSKWECGIGYPDVTLFPVIAELLSVPIGMLFGEETKNEEENSVSMQQAQSVYSGEFEVSKQIKVLLGNTCRVEFMEGQAECCKVKAIGDPVFLRYFDVEREGDTLLVNVKNPCGSETLWEPYDRQGYTGENLVKIYTGAAKDATDMEAVNYLDLHAIGGSNERGNFQVECRVG